MAQRNLYFDWRGKEESEVDSFQDTSAGVDTAASLLFLPSPSY